MPLLATTATSRAAADTAPHISTKLTAKARGPHNDKGEGKTDLRGESQTSILVYPGWSLNSKEGHVPLKLRYVPMVDQKNVACGKGTLKAEKCRCPKAIGIGVLKEHDHATRLQSLRADRP